MFNPLDYPVRHVSFRVKGGNVYDELKKACDEVRSMRETYGEEDYPKFPNEGWDENIVQEIEDKPAELLTRDRGIKKSGKVRRR